MKKIITLCLAACLLLALGACGRDEGWATVHFARGECRVVAHRGLSSLVIENTEAAFVAAGECSYYGIEGDVRRTGDGQFVMCHDDTLQRLTGREIAVESTPLGDLLEVPLFSATGEEAHLCTLDTYIAVCRAYGKEAFLELKSSFTEEEIAQIVAIIEARDYLDGVTFISFYYGNLEAVRRLSPEQSVQYLCGSVDEGEIERLIRDRVDLSVEYDSVTKELVDRIHAAGLLVGCWTIDSPQAAERLVALGVDFITTNILE